MDIYHTSVTFMDFFDRGVCTNTLFSLDMTFSLILLGKKWRIIRKSMVMMLIIIKHE